MPKTEQEQILSRLSIIAKLLAFQILRDATTREQQVDLLDIAGFNAREISDILGIKVGNVTTVLFNVRQKRAKAKGNVARKARK